MGNAAGLILLPKLSSVIVVKTQSNELGTTGHTSECRTRSGTIDVLLYPLYLSTGANNVSAKKERKSSGSML